MRENYTKNLKLFYNIKESKKSPKTQLICSCDCNCFDWYKTNFQLFNNAFNNSDEKFDSKFNTKVIENFDSKTTEPIEKSFEFIVKNDASIETQVKASPQTQDNKSKTNEDLKCTC